MSLDLLAMLFLMHPRVALAFLAKWVHCWLMANLQIINEDVLNPLHCPFIFLTLSKLAYKDVMGALLNSRYTASTALHSSTQLVMTSLSQS